MASENGLVLVTSPTQFLDEQATTHALMGEDVSQM
jgi:hypothetical protein